MTSACVSDLRLDELHAGELPAGDAAAATAHVAGCEHCRDRECALVADRARFRAAVPPLRRGRPWVAIAASALAAAAAVAIVVRTPADATRLKGGPRLAFVVARAASSTMVVGGPGERVRPGDTVSYLVTAAQPSYVAVLSRDPAGRIAPYFPPGDRAQWVPAGRDVQLPIATRLDDSLGRERLAAVFCDHPVALAELTAAVDGAPPEGCTVDRIDLEKVP
jgi:anti-sigma factor RsiW